MTDEPQDEEGTFIPLLETFQAVSIVMHAHSSSPMSKGAFVNLALVEYAEWIPPSEEAVMQTFQRGERAPDGELKVWFTGKAEAFYLRGELARNAWLALRAHGMIHRLNVAGVVDSNFSHSEDSESTQEQGAHQ